MTSWHLPRTLLLASLALAAPLANPEPAHALLGVSARAGAGLHVTSGQGIAGNVTLQASALGWGVRGHYWQALSGTITGKPMTRFLGALVTKNVSPIPMIDVLPGLGFAGVGRSDLYTEYGPAAGVFAAFNPFLLPFGLEAGVGAAWLGGTSLVLPYSVGAKVTLIPLTAFTLRYRGFEGNALLQGASGPEIGFEVGI